VIVITYPKTCVWELTMACNMRCKHCGSSCSEPLPGELTTLEAFKFIDMCKDIGLKWISLSGGEPFVRKDLILLLRYLNRCGIPANIITNGWLITEETARELSYIHPVRVVISVDGPKDVHDHIRKPESFERAMKNFELLNKYNVLTGCTTTLMKNNIDRLEELYKYLVDKHVKSWQFQLGVPMGNLAKNKNEMMLEPKDLNKVIDFFYEKSLDSKMDIYPADCIGYYNDKIDKILKKSYKVNYVPKWHTCNAGKYSFGLLHNGDVIGCTSIRDKKFIEGSIRKRTLREIWEDPNSFSWNRNFSEKDLKGECKNCKHASECLGGCSNTRLTTKGSFDSENEYCTYNLSLKNKVH